MPKEVFLYTKKIYKKNSKIGLLATEGTLKTKIYEKLFKNEYKLITPPQDLQIKSVNKTIKHVKMGNIKLAEKSIKTAINYLIKNNCKKIILGCTELPIAIFAFKSFKKIKLSKSRVKFICISERVAMPLRNNKFKFIYIANKPNQKAIIKSIQKHVTL